MHQTKRILWVELLLILSVLSCKSTLSQASRSKGVVDDINFQSWPGSTIPVCWAKTEYNDKFAEMIKEFRDDIESNVTREYLRAGIKIKGWQSCPDGDVSEAGPYPIKLSNNGNFTDNTGFQSRMGGVNLDMFEDSLEGLKNTCLTPGRDLINRDCMIGTALHEFGHFVGLNHEHERLDGRDRCAYEVFSSRPYTPQFGAYDIESVTNYCRDIPYALGLIDRITKSLSDTDVATIRSIYNQSAVYLKPVLKRDSAFINQDEIIVNISPKSPTRYVYQVQHQEGVKDAPCPESGYTKELISSTIPIRVDLRPYSSGVITVCALGVKEDGTRQDQAAYSVASFIVDKTPWAEVEGVPLNSEVDETTVVKVTGSDIKRYVYKIVQPSFEDTSTLEKMFYGSQPCFMDSGFSQPKTVSQTISFDGLTSGSQYTLCVLGINSKNQKQSLNKVTQVTINYK